MAMNETAPIPCFQECNHGCFQSKRWKYIACPISDNFKEEEDPDSFLDAPQAGLKWTSAPRIKSPFASCTATGVLQLRPPEDAAGAVISFAFADVVEGWVFNLGDSPNNNGYGWFRFFFRVRRNERQ